MSERSKTEIEIEMDIEEEFCAVMERIKSEDIKPFSTESGTFPEDNRLQRLDNSSELCTGIPQLTKDIHPSLRCRLCATPDKDMTDIFSYDATGKNILDMINCCLPVTVKEGDTLPRRICTFCSEDLKRCYRFHETVAKVEKQLLALVKVASVSHGRTEDNNIDVSFQTTSDVEMCNPESSTITEEVQTANTTVNRDVLFSSLKPCSVVLSRIEVNRKNSSHAENKRKSSSDSKLQNPDSQTTIALEDIRQSTCDSEVTRADYSESVADGEDILKLRSGKKVDHKADLVVHGQVDTVKKRYECTLCTKVFTSHGSLNQHNKLHTNKGLHACEYCGKKFTSRVAKDRHCVSHTQERPFECTICEKTFRLPGTLKEHMLVHSNQRPWECDYCKKKFKRKHNLQRHIRRHHSLYMGEGFPCKYCEKEFARKDSLNLHHLTHTGKRPFECSICRKTFRSTGTLNEHKTVHSNERNYACSMCDESFKSYSNRTTHMLVHSNERPWECDHCKKNFKSNSSLQRHIKAQRNLHTCQYCKKKFAKKHSLNRHHLTHTGERPFECSICRMTFRLANTLKQHASVHSNERNYACSMCDKSFKSHSIRKSHMLVHSNERPWECDHCKKSFKSKRALRLHLKRETTVFTLAKDSHVNIVRRTLPEKTV